MVKVQDIMSFLDGKAPLSYKMDFDNVGLLVGRGENEVTRVLLSLDITQAVIDEAAEQGAQLIVSHHPLFFSTKAVNDGDEVGRRILSLAEHRIAAICMHTNLDAAQGGVNDALAARLALRETQVLEPAGEKGEYGIGRIGRVDVPMPMQAFLPRVRQALNAAGLRYHDAGRPVSRVAVGGGACGNYLPLAAQKGCDTFVTADVKYDLFLDAKAMGINLIDAGHFCTENVVIPVLQGWLGERFPELTLRVAQHGQTERFFVY